MLSNRSTTACRLLFPLFALCIAGGCSSEKKKDKLPEAQQVAVRTVRYDTVSASVSLSGNVEGMQTLRLGFMVAGRVSHIAVEEGQSIQKGALLASLDDSDYRIGLEAAEGKLLEVEDKYNRLKMMYDRNSLSEADFVQVKAGLQQARAQQKLRLKNVNDTRLYAPISGVLLKKGVSEGEVIDKGMPVFGLADIDEVKVNAAVPENNINQIRMDQEAKVNIPALDTVYTGKVTEVGLAAEATTRTYNAKITLQNPRHRILPGMIAEIRINTPQKEKALTIPGSAVQRGADNTTFVYVLDGDKKRVFRRNISVGKLFGEQMEVTSGLREGEQIVTEGQQKLYDGTPVTLNALP
ncbi:RND family efflux transporter, MFP subunit [Sinomicrobium oceani]|uniref:RND family efflux transporter, MFP subunit n=1 Tax=Sinomicrobium oceani TaxID=1150368 RepID=A0A1K1NST0_9FLAO|nr:efflux RND transporter periplasmic adaptor subunit [Sinomicrobium oceani]SFW38337.1 RND family efflux transporter, MFP subunit [Sinomicrobium oceani]